MRGRRLARCGIAASVAVATLWSVPVLARSSAPARAKTADPVLITVSTALPPSGGASSGDGSGVGSGGDTGDSSSTAMRCPGAPVQTDYYKTPERGIISPALQAAGIEVPPEAERMWAAPLCGDSTCRPGFAMGDVALLGLPCVHWVAPGDAPPVVTVDDLWPGAYDEARSRIAPPELRVAPGVVQGTLVNAPLWLAVAPPTPVSARAQVGAVWAQVDATFVGLTWDMGVPGTDDDIVECDGPGEEWSEPGPNEDSWQVPPCGWNYDQPSTPEHTGNGANWYDISVTAHWSVHLTGSDGRDAVLDPIDVVLEFDYVVWELQTVGSG